MAGFDLAVSLAEVAASVAAAAGPTGRAQGRGSMGFAGSPNSRVDKPLSTLLCGIFLDGDIKY